jgi:hypothetical protein
MRNSLTLVFAVDPVKRLIIGKRAIRMVAATHIIEIPPENLSVPLLNNLNVNALSKSLMANVMDYQLVGDMGMRYGVAEIMRWKPAFVSLTRVVSNPRMVI